MLIQYLPAKSMTNGELKQVIHCAEVCNVKPLLTLVLGDNGTVVVEGFPEAD